METRIQSYIRTHRKRSGLTQDELAFLLGTVGGSRVSRYERLSREPNLRTAFACQVIFDIPPHQLFPAVFHEVDKAVVRQAKLLSMTAGKKQTSQRTERKIQFVLALTTRKPSNHISHGRKQ